MSGLYGRRWNKARRLFLADNPTCRYCHEAGRLTVATVVDHIVPHRGNRRLFWDRDNWQALCETCHNAVKRAQEHGGTLRGSNTQGQPLDPEHPWNADGQGQGGSRAGD